MQSQDPEIVCQSREHRELCNSISQSRDCIEHEGILEIVLLYSLPIIIIM